MGWGSVLKYEVARLWSCPLCNWSLTEFIVQTTSDSTNCKGWIYPVLFVVCKDAASYIEDGSLIIASFLCHTMLLGYNFWCAVCGIQISWGSRRHAIGVMFSVACVQGCDWLCCWSVTYTIKNMTPTARLREPHKICIPHTAHQKLYTNNIVGHKNNKYTTIASKEPYQL
jgi:hypothetical protein